MPLPFRFLTVRSVWQTPDRRQFHQNFVRPGRVDRDIHDLRVFARFRLESPLCLRIPSVLPLVGCFWLSPIPRPFPARNEHLHNLLCERKRERAGG